MAAQVAVYARVSKADKDDPRSIPVQLANCRARAAEEGWEVVGEYTDQGISGWNPKARRPAYLQMIADLEAGRFDAPLARDTERLLRQDKEGQRWLDLYAAGKVRKLLFVDEADIDLTRAQDRKDFKGRVAAAVYYSERLGEKVRKTKDAQRAAGRMFLGGGRRAYGRTADRTALVADEAKAIEDAARRLLAGGSLYRLVLDWNEAGMKTTSGNAWRLSTLRRMMLSDSLVEAPAILSDDQHALLVARFSSDGTRPRVNGRRYLLAGLVRCSECGRKLLGSGTVAKPSEARYVCWKGGGGCGATRVNARRVEAFVSEWVEAQTAKPKPKRNGKRSTVEAALLREIRELEDRKSGLADLVANGTLKPVNVKSAVRDLDERIAGLNADLRADAPAPARPTFGDLAALGQRYNSGMLTPEDIIRFGEYARALGLREVIVHPAERRGPGQDLAGRVEFREAAA